MGIGSTLIQFTIVLLNTKRHIYNVFSKCILYIVYDILFRGHLALAHQVNPAHQDHRETQELVVGLETQVHQDEMVHLDVMETLDHQVPLVQVSIRA